MPFGFFKKRKEENEKPLHYDPSNIRIQDLRKGFVLDYDLKSWEVTAEYEYDWGNEYFTYEFKLVSTDQTIYLYVEEDDELVLSISQRIPFAKLDERVEDSLQQKGKPPREIIFEGRVYYRDSESAGFAKEVDDPGMSEEFMNWQYVDETGKYILNIEQWQDDEYEASVGQFVSANAFSNILPI